MAKIPVTSKRVAISKANAQMVIIVSVAAFVTVFCLFAAQAVFSQNNYQARVISEKKKAKQQLKDNTESVADLRKRYIAFNSTTTNVIGGLTSGNEDNDGNNSKIILDALPSSYDFPALTSSIEKILNESKLKINSIGGTDDELTQGTNVISPTPQAISMPFTFSIGNANYVGVQSLIEQLERSIRPMQIDTLQLSGGAADMQVSVTAHTYFQPGKSITVTKKVVK